MEPRERYDSVHGAIVATLRHFDPLGHVERFRGERAERHTYHYEATTLIERLRSDRTAEAVESALMAFGTAQSIADPGRIRDAAPHVAHALARL